MTFIVAASLKDCAILAADRETFAVEAGASTATGNPARKITKTANGFITASGFVELLDPVKQRFTQENPETIGEMLEIIEAEQEAFRRRHWYTSGTADWIAKTSWKLTLPMSISGENTIISAAYDPASSGLLGISPGTAIFTFPDAVSESEQAIVTARINQALAKEDVGVVISAIQASVEFLIAQGRPVSREIDSPSTRFQSWLNSTPMVLAVLLGSGLNHS
ncbi:hypothetical protein [Halopseudomonas pelagia]|uniref:hypothetical protein n=1 Tax=Halopseudomonas pelagia TaxID=553151 RepID=UPI0030DAD954|tara:strand:+ start:40266 stop:40931 length:666 start_codon:yes stop_codon:yes gene_type:complete